MGCTGIRRMALGDPCKLGGIARQQAVAYNNGFLFGIGSVMSQSRDDPDVTSPFSGCRHDDNVRPNTCLVAGLNIEQMNAKNSHAQGPECELGAF